jgi:hypothetical protein
MREIIEDLLGVAAIFAIGYGALFIGHGFGF